MLLLTVVPMAIRSSCHCGHEAYDNGAVLQSVTRADGLVQNVGEDNCFMRLPTWLFLTILTFVGAAHAGQPVDLTPVLVTDVSRSIDDSEFQLEKHGYAAALTDPKVVSAIKGGTVGAIAVAYIEFASSSEVRTVLDWAVVHDDAMAKDFADKLEAAPRSFWGRTAISAGIDRAVQMLAESGFDNAHRIIDVCRDGTNNADRDVQEAHDDAVKAGVTINGLAIINDHPVSWTYAHVQPPGGLTNYYRENVTGGPVAFYGGA
jgi:hypothetical protein